MSIHKIIATTALVICFFATSAFNTDCFGQFTLDFESAYNTYLTAVGWCDENAGWSTSGHCYMEIDYAFDATINNLAIALDKCLGN